MNDYIKSKDDEEKDIIDIQIVLSVIIIFTVFVSIILLKNTKEEIDKKKCINKDDAFNILVLNRVIVFIVGAGFFYIAWYLENSRLAEGKNREDLNLQKLSAFLAMVAAFISLYSTVVNKDDDLIVNPIL